MSSPSTRGKISIAVLLLALTAMSGCIGTDGQNTGAAANESPDPSETAPANQSPDDNLQNPRPDGDPNDATDGDDDTTGSYRVPSDAMSADPTETQNGMAKFVIEGEAEPMTDTRGACTPVIRTLPTNIQNLTLDNPGDITYFDVYLTAESVKTDLALTVRNESGGVVASANEFARTEEYVFWTPEEGNNQTFDIGIGQSCRDPEAPGYTLTVWVWTHEDWNANHPFTDVFQKSYEWGQSEWYNPQGLLPYTAVAISLTDWTGATGDGTIDSGGFIWEGCSTNGGGLAMLPCPQDPYTSIAIIIDDDVAGQQVAADFTTCSNDGDNVCGETDNVNDTVDEPGPNELTAAMCGVINGLTRDATTDTDGTGPGVWDQRGERYRTVNGTYHPHPGVDNVVVFLRGPQRGGGGICTNADRYTGPTTGTITLIAQK